MTPEKLVAHPSDLWLKSIGAYVFKPVQTGLGASTLDRLCCINGRFVAIEYKRAGVFNMTPRQSLVTQQIIAAGGIAFMSNSFARTEDYIRQHVLNEYQPRSET